MRKTIPPLAKPALPTSEGRRKSLKPCEAISLRDYFAAHAMLIIHRKEPDNEAIAQEAYALADAMLKERVKTV